MGGPSGSGWPFGRPLLETEVLAILGAVQGVAYAEGVSFALSDPAPEAPASASGSAASSVAPTAAVTTRRGCGCGIVTKTVPATPTARAAATSGAGSSTAGSAGVATACGAVALCPIGLIWPGHHDLTVVATDRINGYTNGQGNHR